MWIWTFGGDFEAVESFLDHLPGGIALGVVGFGAGNAAVIGGDLDRRLGRATGGNCHKIMQLEGLVDGGEGVESVRARGADGEAQIYFAEGADAGGHQAAACRGRVGCRPFSEEFRAF